MVGDKAVRRIEVSERSFAIHLHRQLLLTTRYMR